MHNSLLVGTFFILACWLLAAHGTAAVVKEVVHDSATSVKAVANAGVTVVKEATKDSATGVKEVANASMTGVKEVTQDSAAGVKEVAKDSANVVKEAARDVVPATEKKTELACKKWWKFWSKD